LYVVAKLQCFTANEVVVSRTKIYIGSSNILERDALSLSRGTPPLSKTNNWSWCMSMVVERDHMLYTKH
jgi:hypothetical protein